MPSWQDLAVPEGSPDQPVPAASAAQSPEAIPVDRGVSSAAMQAATFGLSDKAAAAGAATGDWLASLTGATDSKSWNENYHRALEEERSKTSQFAEEHPIAARAGYALGIPASMGTAALGTMPATLGGRMTQGAATGAGIGAISGFAGTNDESAGKDLTATAQGTGLGAILGGTIPVVAEKVISPVYQWAARQFGGQNAIDSQALKVVARRISQDSEAGGPTAQDMLDILAENKNKPMALADVGGANVLGEAGRLARAPGASKQIAADFLAGRDAQAGPRLASDIDQGISAGGSAFDTEQALMDARNAAARPAYQTAMDKGAINSDRLQQFLADPSLRSGLAKGIEQQRLEALARNEPFDPTKLSVQFNEGGDPEFVGVPNMQTLDAGKRGLDAQIAAERNAITGKLSARGNALDQVRRAYVEELDRLNPDYAAARASWSGPSQSKDAITMGQSVFSKKPEEIAAEIKQLSPGDQEFYKLGAADALKTQIAQSSQGANEANRIVGNAYRQAQLKPLFSSYADYQKFMKSALAENTMFLTKNQIVGNSPSAARIMEDAGGGHGGVAGAAAQMIAGAATGEPGLVGLGAFGVAKRLWGAMGQPSPEVNAAAARLLFSGNQEANRAALAQALMQGSGPNIIPALVNPASRFGASIYPYLTRQSGLSPASAP